MSHHLSGLGLSPTSMKPRTYMGIALLTNAVPHDGLRPHDDLLADFPYLGNPH